MDGDKINDYFKAAAKAPIQRDYSAYWLSRQKADAVVTPQPEKAVKQPQIVLKRKLKTEPTIKNDGV